MKSLLLIGVGGFLGAIFRFTFIYFVTQILKYSPPIATMVINVLGSIMIGCVFEYFKSHYLSHIVTLFTIIGFIGSFTTFSTFSFETMDLIKKGDYSFALFNVMMSLLLCLFGIIIGEWLCKILK